MSELERLLYRELYKKSFYEFVKAFWNTADPSKFIDGKLIKCYCEIFQYMCKEWVGYEEKEIISYKLKYIVDNKIKDEIKITYFVHDATKDGGSIKEIFSSIRKIDEVEKIIILDTKIKIDIDDILNVEGDALNIFNDI